MSKDSSISKDLSVQDWSYWQFVFKRFSKNRLGLISFFVFILFSIVGIYAPILASSKPLIVIYNGEIYFPLFRYLFYSGFFTKPIDLFYNVLMFIVPFTLLGLGILKKTKKKMWYRPFLISMAFLQLLFFSLFSCGVIKDPGNDLKLVQARHKIIKKQNHLEDPLLAPFGPLHTWDQDLKYTTTYGKLNLMLRYRQRKEQHQKLLPYSTAYYEKTRQVMPTLWEVDQRNEKEEIQRLEALLKTKHSQYEKALADLPELMIAYKPYSHDYLMVKFDLEKAEKKVEQLNKRSHSKEYEIAKLFLAEKQKAHENLLLETATYRTPLEQARSLIMSYREALGKLNYLKEKSQWLENQSNNLKILVPSLLRHFHWEDDAGGQQSANQFVPWWELTRINRKDLLSGLIFGIRVSLVVGVAAVLLSLSIGIPLGMASGYFGGKIDILICRIVEVWEAMPIFFMLLLVVAITQVKSIFIVILVLGLFGWTSFCRFIRAEVLRQKNLPYVQACHNLGFSHWRIMFSQILPNAIPPILTLLPFSVMAAITSEAGLSFLGLGEEGSTSWGGSNGRRTLCISW